MSEKIRFTNRVLPTGISAGVDYFVLETKRLKLVTRYGRLIEWIKSILKRLEKWI